MPLTAEEAIIKYAQEKFRDFSIERASIDLETDPGWDCCGGTDPDCYCSMTYGPSSELVLTATGNGGKAERIKHYREVLGDGNSFTVILQTIIDIGVS